MKSARLDVDDVVAARQMSARGMPVGDLALAFSVSPAAIRAVLAHRTWRHVDETAGLVAARAAILGRREWSESAA